MTAPKSIPKDAQVMASILKDMGIIEYEPRVINQMLEFTYRYITNILDDARVFSTHAKKKNLDVDDVKLAIQMQMDRSFTTPPPRDILIDISRQRNNMPLPLIKPHCGPRLPPDRYCLSQCNYRLKSTKKPRQLGTQFANITTPKLSIGTVQSMGSSVGSKISPAMNLTSKSGATLSLVGKGTNSPTVTIVTRPAGTLSTPTITTTIKTENSIPPTPIIKLTSGSTNNASPSPVVTNPLTLTTTASKAPVVITRTVIAPAKSSPDTTVTDSPSLKRKREDEDDYDVE